MWTAADSITKDESRLIDFSMCTLKFPEARHLMQLPYMNSILWSMKGEQCFSHIKLSAFQQNPSPWSHHHILCLSDSYSKGQDMTCDVVRSCRFLRTSRSNIASIFRADMFTAVKTSNFIEEWSCFTKSSWGKMTVICDVAPLVW